MPRILSIICMVIALVSADLMRGYVWAVPVFIGAVLMALILLGMDYYDRKIECYH